MLLINRFASLRLEWQFQPQSILLGNGIQSDYILQCSVKKMILSVEIIIENEITIDIFIY